MTNEELVEIRSHLNIIISAINDKTNDVSELKETINRLFDKIDSLDRHFSSRINTIESDISKTVSSCQEKLIKQIEQKYVSNDHLNAQQFKLKEEINIEMESILEKKFVAQEGKFKAMVWVASIIMGSIATIAGLIIAAFDVFKS